MYRQMLDLLIFCLPRMILTMGLQRWPGLSFFDEYPGGLAKTCTGFEHVRGTVPAGQALACLTAREEETKAKRKRRQVRRPT